jgi:RND family efflux transporter MFP subunit
MQNARTALEIARQQNINAGFNQSRAELRATQTGYVLQKFANDGQVVAPGAPVLRINGAANSDWILKVGVSDNQWASVLVGDRAVITTDVKPGKQFPAIVSKKPEGIDPASGTFVLQLKLTGTDKNGIAAGLFGKAEITPSQSIHAWSIPIEALLDGDKSEGYVFITNDRKRAEKIKVTVQHINDNQVVITSGLENAKYLIASGNAYLDNGSKIRIIE